MAIAKNGLKTRTLSAAPLDPALALLLGQAPASNVAATQELNIDLLEDHPQQSHWSMNTDELEWLAHNISQVGVLEPIIVTPLPNGHYRILAGHRRTQASKIAGLQTIPARIMEVDEATEIAIFNATNLGQRSELLPSEKAFAYSELEKAAAQLGGKSSTAAIVELTGDNRRQVQRYKRLLYLEPELLQMVDAKAIPFRAGVGLSYLCAQSQENLLAVLADKEVTHLDIKAAEALCQTFDKNGLLTIKAIESLLFPTRQKKDARQEYLKVKLQTDRITSYFPSDKNAKEIEEIIYQALELYAQQKGENA